MKEHLRMDGIKVFEEESKLLQLVMLSTTPKTKVKRGELLFMSTARTGILPSPSAH